MIQLGGLGIMVFAVLIVDALGLPIGMSHHVFLREDLNQTSPRQLSRLLPIILKVVLISELIGAMLLGFVTIPEFGWTHGAWMAIFHSISAFNNAGFGLFADSAVRWVANPIVNFTIPLLVIVGGLGYTVIADIFQLRRWQAFSLHTKLMLLGTGILLVWSTTMFALLEWDNAKTLGALSTFDKWQASWFQAVISRTAGFNSIDLAGMHDSTVLMFISLMLIGGGSTSTAGGIKVTTFIVLLLATLAFFRRQNQLHIFKRSIGFEQIMKVLAITVITLLIVMFGVFLLVINHDGKFLDIAFEAVSALCTVGVSRGLTTQFDTTGRILLMLMMFIGKVGPLTLGFFLATTSKPRVRYPSGQIYLG
jgi:trk system potassium uptake protein TrkH